MCKQCHSTTSAEATLSQLQTALNNPKYDRWNTTSVDYILLSLEGCDGEKCQRIALEVLEDFLIWYKSHKYDRYYPNCGLQAMYSYTCLDIIHNKTKICLSTKDDDTNKTIHNIIEEEIKINGPNKSIPLNINEPIIDLPLIAGATAGGILVGVMAKLLL